MEGLSGIDEHPLVSVVVSVYNKADFVAETLASVLRQTYQPIELIVVDDGSTDDSASVIGAALEGGAGRTVTLENGGVSRARNAGFDEASSSAAAVLFLDADDVLEDDATAVLMTHLAQHPKAVACYSDVRFVDEHGADLPDPPQQVRWRRTRFGRNAISAADAATPLDAVCAQFWALPSTLLLRSDVFRRTARWDSQLCRPAVPFHAEDKDLAIQLAIVGDLCHVPQRLVRYRVLPSGHKDAMYEGLKRLDDKWWSARLAPIDRRRVRRAIWFDARVQLLDKLAGLRSNPSSVKEAAVSSIRFATTGVRLRLRARRRDPSASA